jgi:hypothetical protein
LSTARIICSDILGAMVVSMEMREKSKPCCRTLFEVKRTKLLFGNAGNNEENNSKPDHNCSELSCHWLVKIIVKIFLMFKINEINAASSILIGIEFFNYFSHYFLT